ncbi:MAG: type II secretion system F family protein, partial [Raoultibacter sp.]
LITQILINMSGWMSQNIVWVLLVMVLLIIGLKLYARTESGKTIFGLIKLKIPVLGVISVYSGAAQCANTLAMLIAAGLSMPRAVHIVSRVTDNHILSSEIGSMEVGLTEGKSLGECMETARHLPRTLIEMTAVGEQTGELEKTLETVGSFYDSETQRVTDRALSLMEPVLLILMAGFVGFIVVALYMPMFSMYASM